MWIDCLLFGAVMVTSYMREMKLREQRNDPRCTLLYTYVPPKTENHIN